MSQNTQTPATPDQKVAEALRKVAANLQTELIDKGARYQLYASDLYETMLAVADEIDPEFPTNQDTDTKVIGTYISPSPIPAGIKDAVEVLRDACEFLGNGSPIRPGSDVATELMALYGRLNPLI